MKEQIQAYLIEAAEALKNGAQWLGGEIPLLVKEILVFNGVMAAIWIAVGVALIVTGAIAIKKGVRIYHLYEQAKVCYGEGMGKKELQAKYPSIKFWHDGEPKDPEIIPGLVISGVVFVLIGFITSAIYLSILLKITLAPRLYLLEYAASIVK